MKIRTNTCGDVVVLSVRGDLLGGPDAGRFEKSIQRVLDDGATRVLVDMAQTRRINSCGVGILIRAHDAVQKAKGRFAIAEATRRINQVFYVVHLAQHIDVYETTGDALAAMGATAPTSAVA